MDSMINGLLNYFATNGTLAQCVAFAQTVASGAWGDVAKLYVSLMK